MTIYYPLTGKETVSITLDYRPYQGMKWIMKLQDNTTVAESLDRYSLEQYASKNRRQSRKHAIMPRIGTNHNLIVHCANKPLPTPPA